MVRATFKEKIKAVKLADEIGVEAASEQLSVPQFMLESWIEMYSGENLYRKACEYAKEHGIEETAEILEVSQRTFYRIRQKYGKGAERKDRRRKYGQESRYKAMANVSKEIGNLAAAEMFKTSPSNIYVARKRVGIASENKKDNILWDLVESAKLTAGEVCEVCEIPRNAFPNFTRSKTHFILKRYATALIAYKLHKAGKINDEVFTEFWNKCRSNYQNAE